MGWSGGGQLAAGVWEAVRYKMPKVVQQDAARLIVQLFEDEDCDTVYEAEDLVAAAGEDWFNGDR